MTEEMERADLDGDEGEDDDRRGSETEVHILAEPRVPLKPDPEFLDPNQGKYKYGIVYLSYIPEGLNVKILRQIMSEFGEVGRIYLEPEGKNRKHRTYVEGWVEFKKKRVAKMVARTLNGTALEYGKKHCKLNGQVWSVDYLHRFKWAHLTEQIAHNKALIEQKKKLEMRQTKKQIEFYQNMTERSKFQKRIDSRRKESRLTDQDASKLKSLETRQKDPRETGRELSVMVNDDLLRNIFKRTA